MDLGLIILGVGVQKRRDVLKTLVCIVGVVSVDIWESPREIALTGRIIVNIELRVLGFNMLIVNEVLILMSIVLTFVWIHVN